MIIDESRFNGEIARAAAELSPVFTEAARLGFDSTSKSYSSAPDEKPCSQMLVAHKLFKIFLSTKRSSRGEVEEIKEADTNCEAYNWIRLTFGSWDTVSLVKLYLQTWLYTRGCIHQYFS